MSRDKIGTVFVKAGLVTPEQLTSALQENRMRSGEKLGYTLVRMKFASDAQVAQALSMQLGFPYIDLNAIIVDPYAVKKVPAEIAMKHRMLPIYIEKNNLVLAVEDPHDFNAVEAARFASGLNVVPHVAAFGDIVAGIRRYYDTEQSASARVQEATPDDDIQRLLQQGKTQRTTTRSVETTQ
jgi:type IV pilus assembly protein PilB